MTIPFPGKLTIIVLILLMLITSLSSSFGFVACDQGCLGSVHHVNHHAGEESHEPKPLPYYPLTDEQGDTCCDFPIRLGDTLVEEVPFELHFNAEPILSDLFIPQSVCLYQRDKLSRQHLARLPLKLLVHRTTVLLI